jgi:myo-inositol-1(or 4)-monophosphatase
VIDATELVALATSAARAAARLHRDGLGRVHQVETKSSPTDVVSEVDRAAEAAIFDVLRAARPDDAFLGEETGTHAGRSGVRWIVDPLDGTTNYLYGYPCYSVSIGIEVDGRLVGGVVHDSVRDRVYAGVVGAGATCDGVAMHVRDHADLATALVATGFQPKPAVRTWQAGVLAHVLPRIRDVRRGGSAAIDLATVACGTVDAFFEAGLSEWDVAAGKAVVLAAGGVVHELPCAQAPATLLVAAGPRLVDALVALLADAGAP